jgi:hypothetical protein
MRRISDAPRYAACLCVLASAFSGCTVLTQAGSVTPLQPAIVAHKAASKDLLYLAHKDTIEVYTYPSGVYEDTVKAPASIHSMCSDSEGNVFLSAMSQHKGVSTGYVYEYAHGGNSPNATLDLPSHEIPVNCSSDPVTGNLAVTSYNVRNYAPSVEIYANARGKPKVYKTTAIGANPQPAYDNDGNLFVTSGGNVGAMLAKGRKSLQEIKLDRTIGGVAHAQWDGKYFALQSFQATKHQLEHVLVRVFRVQIAGSSGTFEGFTSFENWRLKGAGQSWIQGDTLLATPQNYTLFFKYPAGGNPFNTLKHAYPTQAVTVSLAR